MEETEATIILNEPGGSKKHSNVSEDHYQPGNLIKTIDIPQQTTKSHPEPSAEDLEKFKFDVSFKCVESGWVGGCLKSVIVFSGLVARLWLMVKLVPIEPRLVNFEKKFAQLKTKIFYTLLLCFFSIYLFLTVWKNIASPE